MAGFDILTLVGEPWVDSAGLFRGIGVTVTDTASLPSSKFLEFVLNGASIYSVLKTGETVISNATGTSLGGIKLAGDAGEMALTSQIDLTTVAPAEVLRYAWEDPLHVGTDPASGSVLQGMGAHNFSIEGAAAITHIAGTSTYNWAGIAGSRLAWSGLVAATTAGKTIDFTNVGQTTRASPIVSVSANNAADDLMHFGISDGTNWTIAAKVDAAGRGLFQMLDLPEQGAPGDPAAASARVYAKSVNGATKVAFRDATGAETVLGSNISVTGGTVVANSPVVSVSQTWNENSVTFNTITADITDQQSSNASSLIDLKVNTNTVFQVRKTGETVITAAGGTAVGGIKLAGSGGQMALTSQLDPSTHEPAETLRYAWKDSLHVGSDPASASVLTGMGLANFTIEGLATLSHYSGNSTFSWASQNGARLAWSGFASPSGDGKTIDFTNVGQTTRASPIVSVSANNVADDLMHFGISDGTTWTVAAKIDAAGRGNFQMLDLPEQGAPGDPAATTARIYGKSVNGTTKVAFRDATGAETVLGSNISVTGGTVVENSPLASLSQTWNATNVSFNAITANITDTQSSANSTLINFTVNADPVFQVRKTGETVISATGGTSLGGLKLAGAAGEMALTSQTDLTTNAPAETLRYLWKDPLHVGSDPASTSVLQGMGVSNFSIEGPATISHVAGNSAYNWAGTTGPRLAWTGSDTATGNGKTIDFTNLGQTTRASPVMSVSGGNIADDLVHFGLSNGTNWTVAAKIDAAGRGNFQMLDLPEQSVPGNPAATTARVYGKSVNGATKVAFRDATGAETVLGSTVSVTGGTVVANSPLASFSQTWNATNVSFSTITANITDTQSSANSTLISLTVNADPRFQVRKTGETLIHSTGSPWFTLSADLDDGKVPGNARGTFTGIVANWNRNNIGGARMPMFQLKTENLPFFEITPNTVDVSENGGLGARMLLFDKAAGRSKSIGFEHTAGGSGGTLLIDDQRAAFLYWNDVVGGSLVVHFVGTNRVHFWSESAFVHETGNGRFEWESRTAGGRITFVGFLSASAIGATFDFNNFGQAPTRANPVVSISGETTSEDLLHLGSISGTGYTAFSRFDGTGALFAPKITLSGAAGAAPGMAVRLATDTQNRISIGLDANDTGVLHFGPGGTTAPDLTVGRETGTNAVAINCGTTPSALRIYRTYANSGADSEQWNLSWRVTTLAPWASIRTGRTGTGVARNICMEPALIGIGVPVGNGSNIPALKNAAGTLQIRKGDDSDFAAIRGRLTTADSAVPETIVPTSTLILYDANGVAYKVPCVAA